MASLQGKGSKISPIALDDSEEEAIQELSYSQFYGGSSSVSRAILPPIFPELTNSPEGPQVPRILEKKRKRTDDGAAPIAGPSNPIIQAAGLERRPPQPDEKRARKRQKKLLRQAAERQKTKSLDWRNFLPPKPMGTFPLDRSPLQTRLSGQSPFSSHDAKDLFLGDFNRDEDDFLDDLYASSSSPSGHSWVSSMAMVADSGGAESQEDFSGMWSPFSAHSFLPPPQLPPPLPPPLPPRPLPPTILPPIRIDSKFRSRREHSPPSPTFSLPHADPGAELPQIGVSSDHDPHGKHGTFRIHQLNQKGSSITAMHKTSADYAPNPSRAVVMQHIPKIHRNFKFVESWARRVCEGVSPEHIFIDLRGAKALIEFTTAELARKAFASPRLGLDIAMVKKSQMLKGRTRSDLIKVWWYRVGADAGVREIEEGEIEEDPPITETKKQRKNRLAKENSVKAMNQNQKDKPNGEPSATAARPNNLPPLAHELPAPLPSILPSTTPYPFDFTLLPTLRNLVVESPRSDPSSSTGTGQASIVPSGSVQTVLHKEKSRPMTLPSTSSSSYQPSVLSGAEGNDDLPDYEDVMESRIKDPPMDSFAFENIMEQQERRRIPKEPRLLPLPLHPSLPPRPSTKVVGAPPAPPTKSSVAELARGRARRTNAMPTAEIQRTSSSSSSISSGSGSNVPTDVAETLKLKVGAPLKFNVLATDAFSGQTRLASRTDSKAPVVGSPPLSTPRVDSSMLSPLSPAEASTQIPSHSEGLSKQALLLKERLLHEKITRSRIDGTTTPAVVRSNVVEKIVSSNSNLSSEIPESQEPLQNSPKRSVSPSSQAMEKSLRQLVLASKNKTKVKTGTTFSSTPQTSSLSKVEDKHVEKNMDPKITGLPTPPPSALSLSVTDTTSEPSTAASTPTCIPSLSPLFPSQNAKSVVQVSSADFTLEELAVSFITQTIETVKAQAAPSSSSSGTTSHSSTPPLPATTAAAPVRPSSASTIKAELTAKQKRLEQHIEESKSLMERISKSKSRDEKDLLMKILREKTRLFEEENKASEAKTTRLTATPVVSGAMSVEANSKKQISTLTFHFQRWPTSKPENVLILSDDEDDDDI